MKNKVRIVTPLSIYEGEGWPGLLHDEQEALKRINSDKKEVVKFRKKLEQKTEVMENKYYTPSLEEFHVGFEFEKLSVFIDYKTLKVLKLHEEDAIKKVEQALKYDKQISIPHEKVWTKMRYSGLMRIQYIKEYLDQDRIRVKYLDREDIESLGAINEWVPRRNQDRCELLFTFNKTVFKCWFNDHRMEIERIGLRVFNGYIRNISELKTVLKMIGI